MCLLPHRVRPFPTLCRYQILGVVHGLTYLHQYNLVHGNLTGVWLYLIVQISGRLTTSQRNILVDSDGVACISEYGLEVVLRDEASSKPIPANVRWMAPEVLGAGGRRIPTGDRGKAADVYSLAMVMFEVNVFTHEFEAVSHPSPQVLSGTTPFPDESDEVIMDKVTAGLRPTWPSNPSRWLVGKLWEQIEVCWQQEPNGRPTSFEVLQTLLALSEAQHQERAALSVEDEALMWEWEHIKDNPEKSAFFCRL